MVKLRWTGCAAMTACSMTSPFVAKRARQLKGMVCCRAPRGAPDAFAGAENKGMRTLNFDPAQVFGRKRARYQGFFNPAEVFICLRRAEQFVHGPGKSYRPGVEPASRPGGALQRAGRNGRR